MMIIFASYPFLCSFLGQVEDHIASSGESDTCLEKYHFRIDQLPLSDVGGEGSDF